MAAFGEYAEDGTASTMKRRDFKDATDLVAYGFQPRIGRNGRGDMGAVASSLTSQAGETGKGDAAPCVAIAFDSRQDPISNAHVTGALGKSLPQAQAVAYGIPGNWIGRKPENGGNATEPMHNVAPCLTKTDRHGVAYTVFDVRRLTPVECERLQGFPDGYTYVPFNGKPVTDGHRYKALGNSMAVPVMNWIGRQIQAAAGYC